MIEVLVLQLFFPPVLGYLATTKGYKYWPWALIGFFLPVVSIFILWAMKTKPVEANPAQVVNYIEPGTVIWRKDQA